MPRARKRQSDLAWFKVAVTARAVSISRAGARLSRIHPDGESRSVITFEGMLDRPVLRDVRLAGVIVFCHENDGGEPGHAIGATSLWQVVINLPREQFADLLALALSDKLQTIDLLTEGLRRGHAPIRSVSFSTAPLPSERDNDDGGQ